MNRIKEIMGCPWCGEFFFYGIHQSNPKPFKKDLVFCRHCRNQITFKIKNKFKFSILIFLYILISITPPFVVAYFGLAHSSLYAWLSFVIYMFFAFFMVILVRVIAIKSGYISVAQKQ